MTRELTAAHVRRARWQSLGLGTPRFDSPPDVVDGLGALQGQDLPGVLLSLALRIPGADTDDVRQCFTDGTLVRGWPMRGTLHVVRSEDLLPLTQLTQGRVLSGMASRARALGITDTIVDTVIDNVTAELDMSHPVSRAELRAMIARAHPGEPRTEVISHLMYQLSVRGLICHGPFVEGEQRIVLTRRWVPEGTSVNDESFLPRMLSRYISGHGPVSAADAARWFGLPLGHIRRARHSLSDAILDVSTPTGTQWMLSCAATDTTLSTLHRRPTTRLLPGFDEFMLGYSDRSFAVPAASLSEIVPGNNGMFRSTVCSAASVVGTWSRKNSGRSIQAHPFTTFSRETVRGIRSSARELSRITGTQLTVQLPD